MGSRERKRAERRKRKRRVAEHASDDNGAETPPPPATDRHSPADLARRAEAKNEVAREALMPLGEGERPLVVTIGAIASVLLALSIVVGYVGGVEVDGERPPILQVVAPVLLLAVMAWGMWKCRYWAVLGFQTVLLILILWGSLSLIGASDPFLAIGNFVMVAVAGTGFYFMVKALARIQMPDRRPPE